MGLGQPLTSLAVVKPTRSPQHKCAVASKAPANRQRSASDTATLPVCAVAMVQENARAVAKDTLCVPDKKARRRRSLQLPADDLPAEAHALKQRIWESHPEPAFRFRLGKMKRVAVPPVAIPPSLADPSALDSMVAGKSVPMTKGMWQQQRYLFKARRLPSRIKEGCQY